MTDPDPAVHLVRQLVTCGVRLAPSFASAFEELACRTGIAMLPQAVCCGMDLRVLEQLLLFCDSLEGKLALERLWHSTEGTAKPADDCSCMQRQEVPA